MPKMSAAQLGAFLAVPKATLSETLIKAGLPSSGKHDFKTAVRAFVAELRTRADRARDPQVRNRKDIADAQKSELATAQLMDELMPTGLPEAAWEDVLVKLRQVILTFPGLLQKQREGIIDRVHGIKLEPAGFQ